jgi:hypothetical protein
MTLTIPTQIYANNSTQTPVRNKPPLQPCTHGITAIANIRHLVHPAHNPILKVGR